MKVDIPALHPMLVFRHLYAHERACVCKCSGRAHVKETHTH